MRQYRSLARIRIQFILFSLLAFTLQASTISSFAKDNRIEISGNYRLGQISKILFEAAVYVPERLIQSWKEKHPQHFELSKLNYAKGVALEQARRVIHEMGRAHGIAGIFGQADRPEKVEILSFDPGKPGAMTYLPHHYLILYRYDAWVVGQLNQPKELIWAFPRLTYSQKSRLDIFWDSQKLEWRTSDGKKNFRNATHIRKTVWVKPIDEFRGDRTRLQGKVRYNLWPSQLQKLRQKWGNQWKQQIQKMLPTHFERVWDGALRLDLQDRLFQLQQQSSDFNLDSAQKGALKRQFLADLVQTTLQIESDIQLIDTPHSNGALGFDYQFSVDLIGNFNPDLPLLEVSRPRISVRSNAHYWNKLSAFHARLHPVATENLRHHTPDCLSREPDVLKCFNSPEMQATLDLRTRSVRTYNEELHLLRWGYDSYLKRKEIIEAAKESIVVVSPFWFEDQTGTEMVRLICDHSRRLSAKKVLFDFTTSGLSGDFFGTGLERDFRHCLGEGAVTPNFVRFNTPGFNIRGLSLELGNNRIHHKILTVDGEHLITGGLNFADDYFLGGQTKEGWHDLDIYVKGRAAQEASKIVLKDIATTSYFGRAVNNLPLRTRFLHEVYGESMGDRDPVYPWLNGTVRPEPVRFDDTLYNPRFFPELPEVEDKNPVRLIYESSLIGRDPVEPSQQYSIVRETLAMMIYPFGQEFLRPHIQQLRLTVPYLTLTDETLELLTRAARKGVQIQILTNSIHAHDVGKTPYRAAVNHYPALLKSGVEIYEWQGTEKLARAVEFERDPEGELERVCEIPNGEWPGHTLHAKLAIADGRVTFVGSHNFNIRSELYNLEVMALVADQDFSKAAMDIFDYDLDFDFGARIVKCKNFKTGKIERKSRPKLSKRVLWNVPSRDAMLPEGHRRSDVIDGKRLFKQYRAPWINALGIDAYM